MRNRMPLLVLATADPDGYFPPAPQEALLQEHVSHVAGAVCGMDALATVHVHLPLRDGVVGDGLRDVPATYATQAAAAIGPGDEVWGSCCFPRRAEPS
jgi:hypothetical protein